MVYTMPLIILLWYYKYLIGILNASPHDLQKAIFDGQQAPTCHLCLGRALLSEVRLVLIGINNYFMHN